MSQQYRKKRYGKYVFRWVMAILLIGLLILGIVCGVRIRHFLRAINGEIPAEKPDLTEFPVCGIDVSRHQGEIDWNVLSAQAHVQFAFIKATEGSTYQDDRFAQNWAAASETNVFIGAYHFFRFESDGLEQAENFIANVPKQENTLPPVVDIEIYDAGIKPERELVQAELDEMLNALEEYYNVQPILYTNPSTYMDYLFGRYWNYDIWMSNPYCEPIVDWSFWQYSFEGKMDGFLLGDIPVDLNVYNGSRKQFLKEYDLTE